MRVKNFLFIFLIIFLFKPDFSFAQTKTLNNCPYVFSVDLETGSKHEDVVVLQEILNSDKRTLVALSGPGSPGKETGTFGAATRTALKKFQALFIEYIGVADGKFNEKTRTVAQAICDGTLVNVPEPVMSSDKVVANSTPLKVSLVTTTQSVAGNSQLRIYINTNREIKNPTSDAVIVDGGQVSEIRKMSRTQYMAIISPIYNSKQISVQIEAEKISDLGGIQNEDASNELVIRVTGGTIVSTINNAAGNITNSIENILGQITGTLETRKKCNGVDVSISTVCNPPTNTNTGGQNAGTGSGFGGAGGGSGGGGQNALSQMLNGLTGGGQAGQDDHDENSAEAGAEPYTPSSEPFRGGSVDLSNLDVPEFCKTPPNYGGTPAGKCFDMENTTALVKETVALACAAIGKPVPIVSASRNGVKCSNGGVSQSQHLEGTAVDIGHMKLSETDRQKVFEVFYKKGFGGYGCYGPTSPHGVHLDHGPARRWGPNKKSTSWSPSHCPEELFLGGYKR